MRISRRDLFRIAAAAAVAAPVVAKAATNLPITPNGGDITVTWTGCSITWPAMTKAPSDLEEAYLQYERVIRLRAYAARRREEDFLATMFDRL